MQRLLTRRIIITTRLTYETVRNTIENDFSDWAKLKLVSEKFVSYKDPIVVADADGLLCETTYRKMRDYRRKGVYLRFFSVKNPYTFANIQKWLDIHHNGYKVLSKTYVSMTTPMKFSCPKGHSFTMDFHHFKNHGNRCPKCAGRMGSKEVYQRRIDKVSEYQYEILGEYSNSMDHIETKCRKCTHKWMVRPSNLLRGYGCPRCNQSKGEKSISSILNKLEIEYIQEKKFEECKYERPLPFDFFIKNKLLLEYDGELHFAPRGKSCQAIKKLREAQRNDQIKNKYCITNSIPLIRIPYWEFDNIEYIINNVLKYFNIIDGECEDTLIVEKYYVRDGWNQDSYIELANGRTK